LRFFSLKTSQGEKAKTHQNSDTNVVSLAEQVISHILRIIGASHIRFAHCHYFFDLYGLVVNSSHVTNSQVTYPDANLSIRATFNKKCDTTYSFVSSTAVPIPYYNSQLRIGFDSIKTLSHV